MKLMTPATSMTPATVSTSAVRFSTSPTLSKKRFFQIACESIPKSFPGMLGVTRDDVSRGVYDRMQDALPKEFGDVPRTDTDGKS